MADNNVSPGWYPAPENPSQERWWDGNAWTENTRPSSGQAPVSPNQYPTQQSWTQQAQNTPEKSKLPLILGIVGGAIALIIIVVAVFAAIGAASNNSDKDPAGAPTSSSAPSESTAPSEEPSAPSEQPSATNDRDTDPNSISLLEQDYIDQSQQYATSIAYTGLTPEAALDYGYAACEQFDNGIATKEDFIRYIASSIEDGPQASTEANLKGFMFAYGVRSFCPENTATVESWVSEGTS
jgi:hypothetical protein